MHRRFLVETRHWAHPHTTSRHIRTRTQELKNTLRAFLAYLVVIPEGERILLRKILYLRASPRKYKREALAFARLLLRANPVRLPPEHSQQKTPYGRSFLAVVIPEGVEPSIFWMRTRRPRPLDDGTNIRIVTETSPFCKSKKHGIITVVVRGKTLAEWELYIK